MSRFPVERAHRLALQPPEQRWLVEGLWADQAVGILGGEPKCCKTFLALDVAVAVAAGKPCLRRFPVRRPGRVLLFAAEDAHHIVRQRLEGITAAAAVALSELDIQVITAPSLRLDLDHDRRRLEHTIDELRPTLLILDPFVRLHRVDENVSGEVAPLLAFLRELQRRFALAILVVHHARKGGANARAGQTLRGTSEFHAWGDSNLYLRRRGEHLTLQVEHRAAPSIEAITLTLRTEAAGAALVVVDSSGPATPHVDGNIDPIRRALRDATTPLTRDALRSACRMRTATFSNQLREMLAAGIIRREATGYSLASSTALAPHTAAS